MTDLIPTKRVLDPWTLIDLLRFAESRGADALSQLLAGFSDEAADRVAKLELAALDGDFQVVRELAHGLRGSSMAVAAAAVADCCADIESAANHCNRASALTNIARLTPLLDEALSSLQRVLSTGFTECDQEET